MAEVPMNHTQTHNTYQVDTIFAALANGTRRELLWLLLNQGKQPVQQLADHFDMRRPSISEHLKILREAGLVSERKQGRHRYYDLEVGPLMDVRAWLQPYEQFWSERFNNLHQLLAQEAQAANLANVESIQPERSNNHNE